MGLIGYWMFSGSLFCGGSPPFSPSLRMAKEILLRLLYCDQGPFPLMPEGGGGGETLFLPYRSSLFAYSRSKKKRRRRERGNCIEREEWRRRSRRRLLPFDRKASDRVCSRHKKESESPMSKIDSD